MKKLFKTLTKVFVIVILLFVVVSILVATLVDINQYKDEISRWVENETGLKLEIQGDMTLSILSGIKFNAKDIKLFHEKSLIADIDSLRLGIDIHSLFIKEPEITSLELHANSLNISRDKKGSYNFLPMLADKQNDTVETVGFALNQLSIKNIKLAVDRFHYLDDLESLSIKLDTVRASLSLLPIINHHELVIDDPNILVAYSYSGELAIKQALINQYQIADLSLQFKDKMGNFIAEKLAFSFIQEGLDHALPPLVFDARGKLMFKMVYSIPEGAAEPLWARPDVINVGKFDFKLSNLKFYNKQIQLAADDAHLTFEKVAIFEAGQYVLSDLLLKSLLLESKRVDLNLENNEKYYIKKLNLQASELPVFHKGKLHDLMSDAFLKRFAQNSTFKLSSDSVSTKSRGFENVKFILKGNNKRINLSTLSFNAIESKVTGEGFLKLEKEIPQWEFNIASDKLNLQPVANLLNAPSKVEGYVSINSRLSGVLSNSEFGQYVLSDVLVKSLLLESKRVNLSWDNKEKYYVKKLNVQVNDLPVIHKGKPLELMSDVFLEKFAQKGSIRLSCDNVSDKDQGLENVKIYLKGKNKRISLSTLSFKAMDSELTGEGYLKLEKKSPQWELKIRSDKLNLQPVAGLMNAPTKIEGYASIDSQLSGVLQNSDFIVSAGKIQTRANNVFIDGIDLDKILEDFQNSQSVGLLDVGAVALLGPAGMLVTKGNDYRTLSNSLASKGRSNITQLNSDIAFADDIATMDDVAFATERHRLAVKGKINTQANTFIEFEVATVDAHGCPIYKEEVKGSLDSPSVKKVNVLLGGVVNPVNSVISRVTKRLKMHCKEPFYTGVVKSPVN